MKLQRFGSVIACMALLVCSAGETAQAQDEPEWSGSVGFNGIHILTGTGTLPPGAADLQPSSPGVEVRSGKSGGGDFRRILKLTDGRAIVYEVVVKPLEENRRFEVSVRPFAPTPEKAREWGVDPARVEAGFLKNYQTPITVEDGDTLALDVLIDPRTGVKLVDYYRITTRPPVIRRDPDSLAARARQLRAEDIELSVISYELRRNGLSLYKQGGGCGGRFIWVDIPQAGRFVFSVVPNLEAEGFERAAYVSGQQLVFTHAGDWYEWLSERPILPASGVFHVWMRRDPTFSFPKGNPSPFKDRFGTHGAFDALPSATSANRSVTAPQRPGRVPRRPPDKVDPGTSYTRWLNEDVAYVITPEEKRAFGRLVSDEERERFIEEFWRRRDARPETEENEYRAEHYRRISSANHDFSFEGIPGWKTDRGRVYITYGKPDKVESSPEGVGSSGSRSEVWVYTHVPGVGDHIRVEFVDQAGTGDFRVRGAN